MVRQGDVPLSTVVDCDRVYVLQQGQIIEQGSHHELLERGGLYYEMARHQLQLDRMPSTVVAA